MKIILKLLLLPLTVLLTVLGWICTVVLYISSWILGLLSMLLGLIGLAVLVTYSLKNGLILLLLAFVISPYGIPKLLAYAVGYLKGAAYLLRTI